jgi:hypothetical protein
VPCHQGETFTKGILDALIDDAGWTDDDLIRLKLMRKGWNEYKQYFTRIRKTKRRYNI